jgi:hypothetical protein
VCVRSAVHHIFSLTITIDLPAGIADTLFLKGKVKKEQLPLLVAEEHLESVLNQPEHKQY